MKTIERSGLIAAPTFSIAPPFAPDRTVRYVGPVRRATNERVLKQIEKLVAQAPNEPITLFITSSGGPTGVAMSFYDTIRHVLKPRLVSLGSGDVDSSGVILFLSGERRYITARTTLLLHMSGRQFGPERYTVRDMESMVIEDRLKDTHYATLVAERSGGALSTEAVLELMRRTTVLSPEELTQFHLADAVVD